MTDWRADQPYSDLPALPPAAEVKTRPVPKQPSMGAVDHLLACEH